MSIPLRRRLRVALCGDLSRGGSTGFSKVVNDPVREIFTANKDGAVFEFSHKQPDAEFWKGVKYYGSGCRSQIRFRRTQSEPV
jgi:hypothetical protein